MWEEFPSFPAKLEPPEEKKAHFLEKYVGLRARCSHTIKERKRHSDLRRSEKNFFPTFIGGLRADENSSSSNKWRHLSHEGLVGRCSHVHSRLSLLISRGKKYFSSLPRVYSKLLDFFSLGPCHFPLQRKCVGTKKPGNTQEDELTRILWWRWSSTKIDRRELEEGGGVAGRSAQLLTLR